MALHQGEWSSSPARRPERWLEEAIGRHPLIMRFLPELRRLAGSNRPVLISRELAARAVHNLSGRAAHPFVVVDCAGLSEPLLEVELLGGVGEPGGDVPGKVGAFEQAGAGTILVAEVAGLSRRGQELLLGLIERHEVVRLNAQAPVAAPARCIATTSVDLRRRVAAGLFREDLRAGLSGDVLVLPPLRERTDELVSLARRILADCGAYLGGSVRFTLDAENMLRRYTWPGNLRELRETIEEAAVAARGAPIGLEHLPERVRIPGGGLQSLRDLEVHHIERVLHEARGNQRHAARILGISRWSLSRRLRKYGIAPGA
jgi:DNA-binding NtrC family response regulator